MSDANDAVREARAQNKRLAATQVVRKDALAAEVATLEKQRSEAAEMAAAAGGRDDLRVAAETLLHTLDERLTAKRTELAAAAYDLDKTRAELRQLDGLEGQALRNDAAGLTVAAVGGDPLIRSAEQIALDNVRGHIADVDAQIKLGEELSPPPEAAPAPKRMDADQARLEFEALRAKRNKP